MGSKIDPFLDGRLEALRGRLGRLLGFLGSLLGRPMFQIYCKTVIETHVFKNAFFGYLGSLGPFLRAIIAHFGNLGTQNGCQINLEFIQKIDPDFDKFFDGFWTRFRYCFACQNEVQNLCQWYFLGFVTGCWSRGAKMLQHGPKMLPWWPQCGTRWAVMLSKCSQEGPKMNQDASRWSQDGPKIGEHGLKWSSDVPKMAWVSAGQALATAAAAASSYWPLQELVPNWRLFFIDFWKPWERRKWMRNSICSGTMMC